MRTFSSFAALGFGLLFVSSAFAADPKPPKDEMKEIAGSAEFLRSVPKHFATLKGMDRAKQRVTLLMEGETQPREWPLAADAELKINGWWGRLDQFTIGDRVWVWLQLDRVKQPVAVSMLADQISEQDIHGPGVELAARDAAGITLKPTSGKNWTLETAQAEFYHGSTKEKLDNLKIGEKLYVQSAGEEARLILDAAALEVRRAEQKAALRTRWIDEGLPGTVVFLHQFSGEMDFMLDHEAMRWGRSLKPGDKVALQVSPAIAAVVKQVRPWRERTELRLVTACSDQSDLALGQRVRLKMPTPDSTLENAELPPDVDRPRAKDERIEWLLSSIYCTCSIGGDGCTGMFPGQLQPQRLRHAQPHA
ncbi:MAG: hypothetical protein ACJ8FY_09415 [Gemmataceae bacterium]